MQTAGERSDYRVVRPPYSILRISYDGQQKKLEIYSVVDDRQAFSSSLFITEICVVLSILVSFFFLCVAQLQLEHVIASFPHSAMFGIVDMLPGDLLHHGGFILFFSFCLCVYIERRL